MIKVEEIKREDFEIIEYLGKEKQMLFYYRINFSYCINSLKKDFSIKDHFVKKLNNILLKKGFKCVSVNASYKSQAKDRFCMQNGKYIYYFLFKFYEKKIEVKAYISKKTFFSENPVVYLNQAGKVDAQKNSSAIIEVLSDLCVQLTNYKIQKKPDKLAVTSTPAKERDSNIVYSFQPCEKGSNCASLKISNVFSFNIKQYDVIYGEVLNLYLYEFKEKICKDFGFESIDSGDFIYDERDSIRANFKKGNFGIFVTCSYKKKNQIELWCSFLIKDMNGRFFYDTNITEKEFYSSPNKDLLQTCISSTYEKICDAQKEKRFSNNHLKDWKDYLCIDFVQAVKTEDFNTVRRSMISVKRRIIETGLYEIINGIFEMGDMDTLKDYIKAQEVYKDLKKDIDKVFVLVDILYSYNPDEDPLIELMKEFEMIINSIKPKKQKKCLPRKMDANKILIGQKRAKDTLQEIISNAKLNMEKEKRGIKTSQLSFHCAFVGSPGTGKTTFARYLAAEINKLGILENGHFVECSRSDLIGGYIGQTAIKTTEKFNSALGGILFIDEAYSLSQGCEGDFGQEAIDTLLKLMEDHKNDIICIFAGYQDEMREFLKSNPGLESRVPNIIEFEDFTTLELREIFTSMMKRDGYKMSEEDIDFAIEQVLLEKRGKKFGNGRTVRNVFERIIKQQNARIAKKDLSILSEEEITKIIYSDVTPETDDEGTREELLAPVEESASPEDILGKLDNLVGLETVKDNILDLKDYIEVEKMRNAGDSDLEIGLHMAFLGRPGTGKTTVARILGSIFKEIGILPSGHVVEVDRSDLVGEYIGQTAILTKEKIDEAMGGVLFIDEAYTLSNKNWGSSTDTGIEAIETILKSMEDHRGKFVCIFAGYNNEMQTFFESNPGLKSRIPNILEFEDYNHDELTKIAVNLIRDKNLVASSEVVRKIVDVVESEKDSNEFANARSLRNLVEAILKKQAKRLIRAKREGKLTDDMLHEITLDDVA